MTSVYDIYATDELPNACFNHTPTFSNASCPDLSSSLTIPGNGWKWRPDASKHRRRSRRELPPKLNSLPPAPRPWPTPPPPWLWPPLPWAPPWPRPAPRPVPPRAPQCRRRRRRRGTGRWWPGESATSRGTSRKFHGLLFYYHIYHLIKLSPCIICIFTHNSWNWWILVKCLLLNDSLGIKRTILIPYLDVSPTIRIRGL